MPAKDTNAMTESTAGAEQVTDTSLVRQAATSPWFIGIVLFWTSFAVRLYRLGEVTYWLDDRIMHVPNALAYTRYGLMGPDTWWTQPLKHLLLYASSAMFGNDLVAWRIRNVFFGAGVVVLTYLIARSLTRRPLAAVGAALVIALDPLSVAFSRNTSEDTLATFFILLTLLLSLRAMKSDRDLDWLAAGLSMGVSWALRWYSVLPGLLVVLAALVKRRPGGAADVSRIAAYLGILPLSVYVATYFPWAHRGFSLLEFARFQYDAYRVQTAGLGDFYVITDLAGSRSWFTSWLGVYSRGYRPGVFVALFNDFPVWALLLVSTCYLLWHGLRKRSVTSILVAGSFAALYAFFATASRPIMLYSALPLLPLGAVAFGLASDSLLEDRSWLAFLGVAAWSAYLLPLSLGISMPSGTYAWLLSKLVAK